MADTPEIRFTPAQAAAIGARSGSLLVSAAAGSGKTRVLVERVVGLITDPEHPVEADSLLIMTFTNAAAAKLRADIATRLAAEVRAHPADGHACAAQQLLLQRASIGHGGCFLPAFCAAVILLRLDVPPDFETAEEADLARIEQETLAEVLETAYDDPDFRAFADLYDRGRTDQTAGRAILELYHFSRSLPHPDRALEGFAAMWQNGAPPQETPWGRELLHAALARARGAQSLLEAGARMAARDEAADAAYTVVLQEDADRAAWLCKKLEAGDWDAAVAALDEAAGAWRRAGRVKGGKDSNPSALAASELRARAKKRSRACARICCSARRRNTRRTAAARPRWWRPWCGRPAALRTPVLPPSGKKNCWTTPTLNI